MCPVYTPSIHIHTQSEHCPLHRSSPHFCSILQNKSQPLCVLYIHHRSISTLNPSTVLYTDPPRTFAPFYKTNRNRYVSCIYTIDPYPHSIRALSSTQIL